MSSTVWCASTSRSPGAYVEVEAAVVAELGEHVIEEGQAGSDVHLTGTVELEVMTTSVSFVARLRSATRGRAPAVPVLIGIAEALHVSRTAGTFHQRVTRRSERTGTAPKAEAASCPQAAEIERPRFWRIVAFTPLSRACMASTGPATSRRAPREPPGVGLSGMRLTWAPSGRASAGQLAGIAWAVVHIRRCRPIRTRASGASQHGSRAGLHEHRERVAAVERNELAAEFVVGGMERDGEVHLQRICRRACGSPARCRPSRSVIDRAPIPRSLFIVRRAAQTVRSWRAARPCP